MDGSHLLLLLSNELTKAVNVARPRVSVGENNPVDWIQGVELLLPHLHAWKWIRVGVLPYWVFQHFRIMNRGGGINKQNWVRQVRVQWITWKMEPQKQKGGYLKGRLRNTWMHTSSQMRQALRCVHQIEQHEGSQWCLKDLFRWSEGKTHPERHEYFVANR